MVIEGREQVSIEIPRSSDKKGDLSRRREVTPTIEKLNIGGMRKVERRLEKPLPTRFEQIKNAHTSVVESFKNSGVWKKMQEVKGEFDKAWNSGSIHEKAALALCAPILFFWAAPLSLTGTPAVTLLFGPQVGSAFFAFSDLVALSSLAVLAFFTPIAFRSYIWGNVKETAGGIKQGAKNAASLISRQRGS